MPEGVVEDEGEAFRLEITGQRHDIVSLARDLLDLQELPKVERIDVHVDGVAHVPGVEDLDLDGRHEAFARPADLIVGGHRVVIREGHIGHAEPACFVVQRERVDLPGRDHVVGVERVDMEVGRLPSFGQKGPGLMGIEDPRCSLVGR